MAVEVLDGHPLGKGRITPITEEVNLHVGVLHQESTWFYVILSPCNPIILGLPWLRQHKPHISWKGEQILQWDPTCHDQCLTRVNHLAVHTVAIKELPPEFTPDLIEAFSKAKAYNCHRIILMTVLLICYQAQHHLKVEYFPCHNTNLKP